MILNHIDLGPRSGWVTLSKFLYFFGGLICEMGLLCEMGLICEMGITTSHRTRVKICDKVNVHNTSHTAGLGQMVTLILIIITI